MPHRESDRPNTLSAFARTHSAPPKCCPSCLHHTSPTLPSRNWRTYSINSGFSFPDVLGGAGAWTAGSGIACLSLDALASQLIVWFQQTRPPSL